MVIGLFIAVAWVLSWHVSPPGRDDADGQAHRGRRVVFRLTALDRYVLAGVVVTTVMMFVPSEWYEHYAAFDGPFVVLAVALPLARRPAAVQEPGRFQHRGGAPHRGADAGLRQRLGQATAGPERRRGRPHHPVRRVRGDRHGVGDDRRRPLHRHLARLPAIRDSVGTLIATTGGQDLTGSRAVLAADTSVWREASAGPSTSGWSATVGTPASGSPRTWSLFGYFDRHFRLLKFASGFRGKGDVPRGGLYGRV